MSIYSVSMLMTVLANVTYHLSQRAIRPGINPLFSLIITYLTALLVSVISLPILFPSVQLSEQVKSLNLAPFFLGLAIVFLELGFLLAYRAGWNLSSAALFSNLTVTLLLIPIGLIFFTEKLSTQNVVGLGLSIVGLILLGKK